MNNESVTTLKKTVYLPPDIDERLRRSAKKHRRSYNSELVWALQQYLDQQESEDVSLDMLRTPDPVARFEERITEDENGCWIWQGKIGTNGRAIFKVKARTISVHRWAYEHYRGPIPDGLVLDHLCKTPLCQSRSFGGGDSPGK